MNAQIIVAFYGQDVELHSSNKSFCVAKGDDRIHEQSVETSFRSEGIQSAYFMGVNSMCGSGIRGPCMAIPSSSSELEGVEFRR